MDSTASALNQEKIKDETGIETENGAAELSASSTDEAASEHLHGIRLAMIIMANAVAMFLVALVSVNLHMKMSLTKS